MLTLLQESDLAKLLRVTAGPSFRRRLIYALQMQDRNNMYSTFAWFKYSAENRNEINVTAYNIYNNLRHVDVGVGTDVLLL
jgi:hypothetical protein